MLEERREKRLGADVNVVACDGCALNVGSTALRCDLGAYGKVKRLIDVDNENTKNTCQTFTTRAHNWIEIDSYIW